MRGLATAPKRMCPSLFGKAPPGGELLPVPAADTGCGAAASENRGERGPDMQYTSQYRSPIGEILLACDETGLTGLWFEGERFYAQGLDSEHDQRETPVFEETKRWLSIYFSGKEPGFLPPLHKRGSPFQLCVWELLQQIPYGETTTYGELAKQVAAKRKVERMSAQAVGGAVGHNEISIIVPCHRVVGANGSLTGYAGGVDKKAALLRLEGVHLEAAGLFLPTRGTAL